MTAIIQTTSGRYVNLSQPEIGSIDIGDIATALSQICRFTGHTKTFYSVAQHSVYASRMVAPEFALEALMHDAHEAYVGDVSAPLKSLLPDYRLVEKRIDAIVRQRFNLLPAMPSEVHEVDMVLLATERRDVLGDTGDDWPCLRDVEPSTVTIKSWSPHLAMYHFLERFAELTEHVAKDTGKAE